MREIVVGVDASVASGRALDQALLEAQSSGRHLLVVHAWTTPVWMGGVPGFGYDVLASPADSERIARELVDKVLAAGLSRRTSDVAVAVRAGVQEGDPRRVLTDASRDAALLVVGGRGHGTVKSALLGSATAHALHHAQCPVMIVRESRAAGPFQRVIVGVDGSPSSRTALRWGLDAARRQGCPLIALHAWLITTLPGRPPMQFVPALSEYETEAREWLEQEVTATLPDGHGVDVRIELSHSSPVWALLDKAHPDDLLVLGSRGRGGFARLVLGSVATQCSQHARSAVVVVRADQERLDP